MAMNDEDKMKDRFIWNDLYNLYERKDGPIKEALTSLARNDVNRCVGVTAQYDEKAQDIEVKVGYLGTGDNPYHPHVESVGNKPSRAPKVETFHVALNEAKDFFGTEPVKVAREFGRSLSRNFRTEPL